LIDPSIRNEFEDALRGRGIIPPPGGVIADGKLRRADAEGKNGKSDAAYLLYDDHPVAGGFENWRDGRGWAHWRSRQNGNGRVLSAADEAKTRARWAAARKVREEERRIDQEKATAVARKEFESARQAPPDHRYLVRKKIAAHDLRVAGGKLLLIPMQDIAGMLWNLQRIDQEGGKRFLFGGRTEGLFYKIGPDPAETIIIAEGVSTALSIFEATALPVVAAMSAGNLLAVGRAIREKYPQITMIYFADNDNPDTNGVNVGVMKATEAAKATGGIVVMSPTVGDDANDLYIREGADAVKAAVDVVRSTTTPESDPTKKPASKEKTSKKNPATVLVDLAESVELFHTRAGEAYATIPTDGHRETWKISSSHFRRWLGHQYHQIEGTSPGSQALVDARLVLEGKATYEAPELEVFVRVAGHGGSHYLDVGDAAWSVIEITSTGWRVLPGSEVPVKFRRPRGMAGLPIPEPGGSINDLRPFVNVRTENDWMLIVAWLLGALTPQGPYPILCFVDEQGTGKTTTARRLVGVADPSCPDLRSEPKNPHDLAIAAENNWVLVLDNLSFLKNWFSDCLCRLSTGGGFATRELYTNGEEALFDAKRPVILTGIDDLTARGDLMDRTLNVSMAFIPEAKRRQEREMDAEFDAARPKILGAILDVLSGALRDLPNTTLALLPRMADFAVLIAAAEKHLGWEPGSFAKAYSGNRADAHVMALESSPVGSRVREFVMSRGGAWTGTMDELLREITTLCPRSNEGKPIFPDGWPKTAKGMGSSLRRVAPHLRQVGFEVKELPRENNRRPTSIRMEEPPAPETKKPSQWEEEV